MSTDQIARQSDQLRDDFRRGVQDILPILVGVIPFGLVFGAVAVETGLTTWEAMGFSLFIFAGASQLAAVELLAKDASVVVIVFTIAVINLRMLMYSASLAPEFAGVPRRTRVLGAYLLTDQAYAVTIAKADELGNPRRRFVYYLGAAIPLYVNWQLVSLIGAVGGAAIPDSIPLDFAIPMVFLVLLVPAVKDRPGLAAAATAGVLSVALGFLPANLGLFVAALSGVGVGTWLALQQDPNGETPTSELEVTT